ncbi:iron uptake transporter deferrochelatase/peroxidase subunit [Saccharibacillus brassicae]|uniref:Deferrochelatase n=1 Tax=Saccharibacillus brassicae TaxID=2583377 RepID=A0A4Y6UV53_SACBS|nr:iron uptake transporter deferrochelatase/peroxidase subunit [Saccharibacillus brassicae]QDH21014.1 deferrochelatase/peroxidase EfeB [Saccharibacillus brassicae]
MKHTKHEPADGERGTERADGNHSAQDAKAGEAAGASETGGSGRSGKGYTRREMLKMSAAAGGGIALGASGLGAILKMFGAAEAPPAAAGGESAAAANERLDFYGEHQAGIVTPQQTYMYLVGFKVTAADRKTLIGLLRDWTRFCDLSTGGASAVEANGRLLPPSDSGESVDLPAAKLSVTFGFGPSLFAQGGQDRFGLAARAPKHLRDIPRMPKDRIDEALSGGDICVQVCAEDQQVAFHAARNLIRLSAFTASVLWMQEGFISSPPGSTPRNLFGFKDGTANALHDSGAGYGDVVWCGEDEPDWMRGGSYLAYRKIRMLLEVWDRSSLKDQEDTFGRRKDSGAAYGKTGEFDTVSPGELPADSHVRLAKQDGAQMHRRAYSYTGGIDARTGNVDAGLLFLSYQRDPDKQFVPMLRLMSQMDKLNEYTVHIASGLFACPGGWKPGEYVGQRLLEG